MCSYVEIYKISYISMLRMASIGLLVLTKPKQLKGILPVIKQHVSKTLYVQLYPGRQRLANPVPSNEIVSNLLHHGPAVVGIYSQVTAACQQLDVRVLLTGIKDPFLSTIHTRKQIEVVIFDAVFDEVEVDNFLKSCLLNATQKCQIVTVTGNEDSSSDNVSVYPYHWNSSLPGKELKIYENVVLGGTFDRLHAGHKILLSEAALRCTRKLTVGVVDTPMLKSKVLWELIEPCADRVSSVEDFLQDIDPSLQYHIVLINDPFGPTKGDPTFQLLVVSAETYKGGLKVNEIRLQNNLSALDIHTVDLLETIPEHTDEEEEEKISSTSCRMRLLGTRLRVPEARPLLPRRPYIIGLTGNIASGKSSIGQRLENLGAGLLNCDILAHSVYRKGEPCYESIVQHFGKEILDDRGEVNRKALGEIVFNCKEQLQKLNSLVWPILLDRANKEIQILYKAGYQIIVMEAAVLLQAGWDQHVHEVWACIIPVEEVTVRHLAMKAMEVTRSWQYLSVAVAIMAFILSKYLVMAVHEDADDNMQADGVPEFLPRFLQQGEWGKAFAQARASSSEDDADSHKNTSTKKQAHSGLSGSSSTKSTSKKTGKSYGGDVKGIKRPSEDGSHTVYSGGCARRPNTPQNAVLQCSIFSGCRASCMSGYMFPNGEKQLFITCQEGEWQVENAEWEVIPHCEPVCLPPCQHNGICVKPNECNCPENYAGPQCQFEKKPCLNYPPLSANSRRSCNSKTCTVMCADGYKFPDGSAIANMVCREGTWIPSQPEWKNIPDCQPVCKPPCENGGNCLSFNVCQCPQEFRGPQCQYAASACSAEKLGFNGGYKCKGSDTSVTCTVSCPSGSHFQEQPASQYVCSYSVGAFQPAPVPQCVFEAGTEVLPGHALSGAFHYGSLNSINSVNWSLSSNWSHLLGGVLPLDVGTLGRQEVSIVQQLPHPGFCYIWGRSHFRTFDGQVFSFESQCSYTVMLDVVDNTFNVNLEQKANRTVIKIFAQDKEYTLMTSEENIPVFYVGTRRIRIPTQLSGVIVEHEAHFIIFKLTGTGLTLKWDGQDFVAVTVTESLWNRSAGLCGLLDGRAENDFISKDGSSAHSLSSFINSWKVKPLGDDHCSSPPVEAHACGRYKIHDDEEQHFQLESAATSFCNKLLHDTRFAACRAVLDVKPYYEACKWDFCSCRQSNSLRNDCACQSFAVFAKVCSQHGKTTAVKNWRDNSMCPMKCTGGRVYFPCGPSSQETCKSVTVPAMASVTESCEEGCYCPVGTVLYDQQCVSREQCPCQLRGRMFQPGEKVPKDCNTCTCVGGQWSCTQINCGARCGAVGDPHYLTFDGKHFNFMGKCSYYLMKGDNYSIEAENVACAGAISEAMSFLPVSSSEYPSCTKTVTIHLNEHNIKLKQGHEVLVDGQEVSNLPFTAVGAYIHSISSIFLTVDLPNGLEVWWDGVTRVYIDVPASFQGNTKGLCGTFNQNQNDDFLTPEGDTEQDVVAFANKWKTSEVCEDIPKGETPSHPCDVNAHNRVTAEKHCSKLKGSLFEGCHWLVDPEPYYQDCLYDLCSCQMKVAQCLCPIFAAYAKECAHKEVMIDWRNDIRECGIHCPGGQIYQICGNTCTRSCYDISRNPQCRKQCVEGCNCPEGQTLDPATGECIPVDRCVCQHDGLEYPAGFKEVRAGNKGLELCLCRNALWQCRLATPKESEEFPQTGAMVAGCSRVGNQEFTTCEPVEPVTCKNMHNPPQYSPAICRPGCKCKKGYVLDSHTKKCIKPVDCPCHHGGKSYGEGDIIQEDCNTCKCESGKWLCSERVCAGICTAWGDSHYKTFDGRIYDFHGNCDYVLVKGSLGFDDIFDVSIQNVPCGSSGISCSKSVTLRVGSSERQEIITFTGEKPIPSHTNLGRITIREAGLFVFAEVFDLGLVLQWDRGTRVYVRADPRWKDRLKGLCGNYNDNQLDDFQTPSGGLSEVSARLFGDSWRLQSYCPESVDVVDTCLSHPNRKLWAMKKCGVLKSSVFQPCHSEVPLEPYLERCIFDACGCDLGGDCECLCTAIAAYAQECNIHGVSVKWRSQQLCPIQCDEKCSHYSPCVQTCPKRTCDNYIIHSKLNQLCSEDACVEGCEIMPCPSGQVFSNLTSLECVPTASCKPFCLQIGDVIFYEGDVVEQDDCHKCMCSHQKKICLGQPCTSTTAVPSTSTPPTTVFETSSTEMGTEAPTCKGGWTKWLSQDNQKYGTDTDVELLPTVNQMIADKSPARCNVTEMKNIECRVVGTQQFYKDTGENVECSIMNGGLKCVGGCQNYEIRVLCKCPTHCDVNNPNSRDAADCHRFYHCKDTAEGPELVEKTCGPYMMYNHEKQVCDWPATVIALRPECAAATPETTSETAITPMSGTPPTVPTKCKPGWSPWYNTPRASAGDFERLDDLEAAGKLPCGRHKITNIECSFYRNVTRKTVKGGLKVRLEKRDYTESGDHVTCKPTSGLACNNEQQGDGLCEDYTIRVFCTCEETSTVMTTVSTSSTSPCDENEVWSGCVVPCSQVCLYYDFVLKENGLCSSVEDCVPGCVPASSVIQCPLGSLWRDAVSCVRIADCTCRSHSGKPVKPGSVVWESECEVCQCIDNQYECDTTACNRTTFSIPATQTEPTVYTVTSPVQTIPVGSHVNATTPPLTLTVKTTVTPPPPCDVNRLNYIIAKLPDVRFSSGNTLSPHLHNLQYVTSESSDAVWKPTANNKDQYLQVDLGNLEPLYGTTVWGNPKEDEYVTSYMVLYSDNGQRYTYVTDAEDSPAIFRGPVDHKNQVRQQFFQPVEARYVRWNPLTWHSAIAMKVDLLGCGELTTESTIFTSPTPYEVCTDRMGLENGLMADQQFTASSVHDDDIRVGPAQARLNGDKSWVPTTHHNQWIQFDFLEPRNLTGIITQGNKDLNSWIESYSVQHSLDGKAWNPLLDAASHSEKVFLANFDSVTPHQNLFDRMLHTRYLRLFPRKWHKYIALRAEVLGCYKPYPTPPAIAVPSATPAPPECNACPGWHNDETITAGMCQCLQGKFWNGETCVNRTECPCYVGYIAYSVGTLYDSHDCKECICKIGGIASCKEKICPHCEQNLQRVLTPSCGCTCKPCPPGTVLCPTSNICINVTSWCDGLEDCPDDERECTTSTVPTAAITPFATQITPTETPPPRCPPVECPEGFKVSLKETEQLKTPEGSSTPIKGSFKGVKNGRKKGRTNTTVPKPQKLSSGNICPEFVCAPIKECTVPKCPPNFVLHTVREKNNIKLKCPIYICVPPAPPHATCNITGQTFHTFDGTEFKHDVCNHILARDLKNDNWGISVYKDCPEETDVCKWHLVVVQDENEIQFHPDLSVNFNNYKYSIEQLQRIGSQLQQAFTVSKMGGILLFQSRHYGFQVMWDTQESIKIHMPGKLAGHVDGLCGFFNQNMRDDKMKPDGKLGRTTAEFVDSWVDSFLEAKCRPVLCHLSLQEKALHMCSLVREPLFAQCRGVVNVEKYVSHCIETTCSCLQASNSTEAGCQCQALLGFVTQCTAAESSVDLSTWRVQHNCPAFCPPPLVYHDCFQRECEPNCNSMRDRHQCPAMPGTCIPGCFCPDGLVRKGDKCVKPDECRDCVCNGFGDPQYLTFDHSNYTFNGNCTYVAARDVNPHGKHTFEVLVTNVQCRDDPVSTCTKAVFIVYKEHRIHIQRKEGDKSHELEAFVDGSLVNSYPLVNDWMQLEQVPGMEVTVLIPEIQLEVSYFFHNFAFVVRLPSHTYGHATEGLCGNCNGDSRDDFKTKNGTVTRDTSEFGSSWLYPLPSEMGCNVIPEPEGCIPLPPDQDPCFKLLDEERFGGCYPLVDPYLYVAACQYDRCHTTDKETSLCRNLEAYARACMQAGLCLNWRTNTSCPYLCAEGFVYRACGLGCPQTCDNYKHLIEDPSSCDLSEVDGCFCADGQVLIGGVCKDIIHCFPCDEEGHLPGQVWNPDNCTACTCSKDGKVACLKTECPAVETICDREMTAVAVPGTEGDCCQKYICVSSPTPQPTEGPCPEVQIPLCHGDQQVQSSVNAQGCTEFICVCKPCEPLEERTEDVAVEIDPLLLQDAALNDRPEFPHRGHGWVQVNDTRGCCPHLKWECRQDSCPKHKPCQEYYKLHELPVAKGECCPVFKCEPPNDTCLYEYHFIADISGGERPRSTEEKFISPKEPGSHWNDGPCRTCTCEKTAAGGPHPVCKIQACSDLLIERETTDYELEKVPVPNQCCPSIVRIACKEGDTVYKVGSEWPSPSGNPCETYVCEAIAGTLQKVQKTHECNMQCELGFEYVKPAANKCCGHCHQFACVVNGEVKEANSNWTSADLCTTNFCLLRNGSHVVQSLTETCPVPPPELAADYVLNEEPVPLQCCKKIVPVACRVGDSIYKEGESWLSPDGDPCKNLSCVKGPDGAVRKEENTQVCNTECAVGWQYIPPHSGSGYCCGQCEQVACVVDDKLYKPGTEWSSDDGCLNHSCSNNFTLTTMMPACPELNCPPENTYSDGCCERCSVIVENMGPLCEAAIIPPKQTVGLISLVREPYGRCTNTRQIHGFTKCSGKCYSDTVYNSETGLHDSNCDCCKPAKLHHMNVTLLCDDSTSHSVSVTVPTECACSVCNGPGPGSNHKGGSSAENIPLTMKGSEA